MSSLIAGDYAHRVIVSAGAFAPRKHLQRQAGDACQCKHRAVAYHQQQGCRQREYAAEHGYDTCEQLHTRVCQHVLTADQIAAAAVCKKTQRQGQRMPQKIRSGFSGHMHQQVADTKGLQRACCQRQRKRRSTNPQKRNQPRAGIGQHVVYIALIQQWL